MLVSALAIAFAAIEASSFSLRGPETVARPANALTLTLAAKSTAGGNVVQGSVVLPAPAPVGGLTVTLSSSSPALAGYVVPTLGSQSAAASLTVTVRAGLTSADFTVRTFGVAQQTTVTLRAASNDGSAAVDLVLVPARIQSIAISPTTITGGQPATATISLDGRAVSGGTVMSFSVGGPLVPPSPVTVAPGVAVVSVPLTTNAVATTATATMSASLNGNASPSASLLVMAPVPASIQLAPQNVFGGAPASATIVLSGKAPGTGITLALVSSSTAVIVPSSVVVPAGNDRVSVNLNTQPVGASQSVAISASPVREAAARSGTGSSIADGTSNTITPGETISSGRISTQLGVFPLPQLQSIAATPAAVFGGDSLAIALAWSGATAAPGLVAQAQLSSNHPELLSIPSSVALAPQLTFSTSATKTTVAARTSPPAQDQTVTIEATLGTQRVSTLLVVKKPIPPMASFAIRPTTFSGGNLIAQVSLDPSVAAPVTIGLTTNHPEIVHLPATIAVAPSSVPTPFTFTTTRPASPTTVTITASARGQIITATLTANP